MQKVDTLHFEGNEAVYQENEFNNLIYFPVFGSFALYRDDRLLGVVDKQKCFGEEIYFNRNYAKSETVVARGSCSVLVLTVQTFN